MIIWILIVDTQQNVFFFSLNTSLSQLRLFTRPGPAGDAVVSAHNEHCSITYPWGKESEPSSIPHGWLVSHQLIKTKGGGHCLHGVGSWIFETRAEGVVYWTGWRDAGRYNGCEVDSRNGNGTLRRILFIFFPVVFIWDVRWILFGA